MRYQEGEKVRKDNDDGKFKSRLQDLGLGRDFKGHGIRILMFDSFLSQEVLSIWISPEMGNLLPHKADIPSVNRSTYWKALSFVEHLASLCQCYKDLELFITITSENRILTLASISTFEGIYYISSPSTYSNSYMLAKTPTLLQAKQPQCLSFSAQGIV